VTSNHRDYHQRVATSPTTWSVTPVACSRTLLVAMSGSINVKAAKMAWLSSSCCASLSLMDQLALLRRRALGCPESNAARIVAIMDEMVWYLAAHRCVRQCSAGFCWRRLHDTRSSFKRSSAHFSSRSLLLSTSPLESQCTQRCMFCSFRLQSLPDSVSACADTYFHLSNHLPLAEFISSLYELSWETPGL
jgi:hypothetical protein